ncbi:MAG: hypothetical protein ACHQJ6_06405 [Candidatus Berkiellales bacterium]
MRKLTVSELSFVSGGENNSTTVGCISNDMLNKIHNKAWMDGVFRASLGSAIIGGGGYAVAYMAFPKADILYQLAPAAAVALLAAPYEFMWGYFKSSAWNIVT